MIKLVTLEAVKSWQSGYIKKLIILLFLYMLGVYGFYAVKDMNYLKEVEEKYTYQEVNIATIIEEIRLIESLGENNQQELEYYQSIKRYYDDELSNIRINKTYSDNEAKERRLAFLEDVLKGYELGYTKLNYDYDSILEEYTILHHNISQDVPLYSSPYTPSFLHFTRQFYQWGWFLGVIVMVGIYTVVNISHEYEMHAYVSYMTRYSQKFVQYLSRMVACLLVGICGYVLVVGCVYLLSSAFYGFGESNMIMSAQLDNEGSFCVLSLIKSGYQSTS